MARNQGLWQLSIYLTETMSLGILDDKRHTNLYRKKLDRVVNVMILHWWHFHLHLLKFILLPFAWSES